MYTKKVMPNLFGDGGWTGFYKNSELIATREDGEFIKLLQHKGPSYDTLTRAKGYRYWERHFKERYYWALPDLLQDAIDMPSATSGYFIDRHGELHGYEG